MTIERSDALAIVHVLPAGVDIAVREGETLMRAAQSAGIRWPNVCNGQAQCGVCAVEVVDGDLSDDPSGVREKQMLERLSQGPKQGGIMRLACQIAPSGRLTVWKLGVRPPRSNE